MRKKTLIITLMLLTTLLSVYVISVSLSTDVKKIAGGSVEVKKYNIKISRINDRVWGNFLLIVDVDIVVDVSGNYNIKLTVWNDGDSRTISQTLYLNVGTNRVSFIVYLREGDVGFSHSVEVSPA